MAVIRSFKQTLIPYADGTSCSHVRLRHMITPARFGKICDNVGTLNSRRAIGHGAGTVMMLAVRGVIMVSGLVKTEVEMSMRDRAARPFSAYRKRNWSPLLRGFRRVDDAL